MQLLLDKLRVLLQARPLVPTKPSQQKAKINRKVVLLLHLRDKVIRLLTVFRVSLVRICGSEASSHRKRTLSSLPPWVATLLMSKLTQMPSLGTLL